MDLYKSLFKCISCLFVIYGLISEPMRFLFNVDVIRNASFRFSLHFLASQKKIAIHVRFFLHRCREVLYQRRHNRK